MSFDYPPISLTRLFSLAASAADTAAGVRDVLPFGSLGTGFRFGWFHKFARDRTAVRDVTLALRHATLHVKL